MKGVIIKIKQLSKGSLFSTDSSGRVGAKRGRVLPLDSGRGSLGKDDF